MRLVTVSVVGFATAVLVVVVTRWAANRQGLLDIPNSRSSHARPVPRLGGLGIVLGFLAAVVVGYVSGIPLRRVDAVFVFALVAVSALGGYDDLRALSAGPRLLAQLSLAAAYCVFTGPLRTLDIPGVAVLHLGLLAYPFSILWIAWMVNLYNFMDGIDGIAGTQAVVASGVFAVAALQARDLPLLLLTLSLGAASLGFLVFNAPPASIFMGDVGSTALGFAFAALALRAAMPPSELEFPAGVLAVGPFVFDATFTLFRRILYRERFWQAHRSHIYQRPQNWGVSHGIVTLAAAALMALSGLGALSYHGTQSVGIRVCIVGGSILAGTLVAFGVLVRDRRSDLVV